MAIREKLFRGKRVDNGELVISNSIMQVEGQYPCLWVDSDVNGWVEVIPETVGEYTGLTDKNGKKIFEGDIVCTRFPKECEHAGNICSLGDIQFRDGMFGIEWTQWKNDTFWGLRRIDEGFHKEIEIIGNIYYNPELLEVGV